MRVLVTGGAGFIGSHVVDNLLSSGAEVRVLDALESQVHQEIPEYLASDAELVVGDVRDREVVRGALAGVDRVVHLAAAVGVGQSMYEVERYSSINVIGAAVVLEETVAVRDRIEKMVVASSMSIYGEGRYLCRAEGTFVSPKTRSESQLKMRRWEPRCSECGGELEAVATTETTTVSPESIYAIGKRDHEEMFLVAGRAYGIPATALRFFNVYGSRQALSNPYTGVAAIFSSRLMSGNSPIVFEDGHQSRDFVHVSDVVRAVVAALEPGAGNGEAVNIGTGKPTTILDVAEVLANELGVGLEPEIRNVYRAGDIRHCFASVERAKSSLGYEPRVQFAEGMRELVDWLAGTSAVDRVLEATAELEQRGLTV